MSLVYRKVVRELEVGIEKDMTRHALLTELFGQWHAFKCYASDFIDTWGRDCDLAEPVVTWINRNPGRCTTETAMHTFCRRYRSHRLQVLYRFRQWKRDKPAPYKERLPIGEPFKDWVIEGDTLRVFWLGEFTVKKYSERVKQMGYDPKLIEGYIIRRGTRCCLRIVYSKLVPDAGQGLDYAMPLYTRGDGHVDTVGTTVTDAALVSAQNKLRRAIAAKCRTAEENPFKLRRRLKVQRCRHAVRSTMLATVKRALAVIVTNSRPREVVYIHVSSGDERGLQVRLLRYYDHAACMAARYRCSNVGMPFREVYWKTVRQTFAHPCGARKCLIKRTPIRGEYVTTCGHTFTERAVKMCVSRSADMPVSKPSVKQRVTVSQG